MLDKLNERLEHYEIKEATRVILEDQEYHGNSGAKVGEYDPMIGYAVVNKANGITEFTTMVLPTAIFQADYLDKALESLLNPPEIDVEVEFENSSGPEQLM